jgi:hypothetical protein
MIRSPSFFAALLDGDAAEFTVTSVRGQSLLRLDF